MLRDFWSQPTTAHTKMQKYKKNTQKINQLSIRQIAVFGGPSGGLLNNPSSAGSNRIWVTTITTTTKRPEKKLNNQTLRRNFWGKKKGNTVVELIRFLEESSMSPLAESLMGVIMWSLVLGPCFLFLVLCFCLAPPQSPRRTSPCALHSEKFYWFLRIFLSKHSK